MALPRCLFFFFFFFFFFVLLLVVGPVPSARGDDAEAVPGGEDVAAALLSRAFWERTVRRALGSSGNAGFVGTTISERKERYERLDLKAKFKGKVESAEIHAVEVAPADFEMLPGHEQTLAVVLDEVVLRLEAGLSYFTGSFFAFNPPLHLEELRFTWVLRVDDDGRRLHVTSATTSAIVDVTVGDPEEAPSDPAAPGVFMDILDPDNPTVHAVAEEVMKNAQRAIMRTAAREIRRRHAAGAAAAAAAAAVPAVPVR